jgi:DNA-binding transcriptional ArsR family regulator
MGDELSQVRLSGRQIRVLAHPLRIRLLGRLRGEGAATATRLAAALGTNTGATSYHLRQLAEAGLVVEEERPGSGRQRWWRAVHDMSSWRRSYYLDDPDATAAAEWLEAFQVNRFVESAEAWRRALPAEPPEWRDAGEVSDYLVTLDPARIRDLMGEIEAVVERYRRIEPAPDARAVTVYLAALPKPAPSEAAPSKADEPQAAPEASGGEV